MNRPFPEEKMEYPVRKNPRLPNFDYSSNGAYFITICTNHRRSLFSHIDVGAIHESPASELTEYGKIVESIIFKLPERFHIQIDHYVIMPNHIHLLLQIDDSVRAIRESPLHERSMISKIVGYLKMNVSKQMHDAGFQGEIWQRSFHDHIVRGKLDYDKIWMYIETNPLWWNQDCFYQEG